MTLTMTMFHIRNLLRSSLVLSIILSLCQYRLRRGTV